MVGASLATATATPEFVLNPVQTSALAEAGAKVARHFPSVLTQKQQDIAALALCVGSIAFAQSTAYQHRKAREKEEKARAGNVAAFPPGIRAS